jgi:hypothetical protein
MTSVSIAAGAPAGASSRVEAVVTNVRGSPQ